MKTSRVSRTITALTTALCFAVMSCKGADGATGPAGANGTNGAQGLQGPTGPQGTTGTTGLAGPPGPAGTNGTNGTNGATGATGKDGTNGTNGATGATGATGPQGPAGTNSAYWAGSSTSSDVYVRLGVTDPSHPPIVLGYLNPDSTAYLNPSGLGSSSGTPLWYQVADGVGVGACCTPQLTMYYDGVNFSWVAEMRNTPISYSVIIVVVY